MTVKISDFETALNGGELSLAFQPIVEMKHGNIVGFEAFMRWTHPVHGAIPPSVFIPLAEESGLIVQASRWALKESCRALKRMSGSFGYDEKPFMSVNFSVSDLDDKNFLEQLYTIISVVDLDPSRIYLEITEKLLEKNPDKARETLNMCRRAGLTVAIDDFNTHSSSLQDIHSFGINLVKIDQIADHAVRQIIDEAHALGMQTSAEGVETEEEAITLRTMGCHMAQGYYFARPMNETQVIEFMRERTLLKTG